MAALSVERSAERDCGVSELLAELQRVVGERRAAREILAIVWDKRPTWLATQPGATVPRSVQAASRNAAARVAAGEPLAYATGCAAFRHLTLRVDTRVLIPRPETEIVVEEALRLCPGGTAADIGTGSGAIALALATEGSYSHVIATDISTDALAVARMNAARAGADVEFRCGALLEPLQVAEADLIVANPPYITAAEMLQLPRSVRDWEPPVALASGTDGLAHTRELIRTAALKLPPGGCLVLECDSRRAGAVDALLRENGAYHEVSVRADFAGRPRVAVARRRRKPTMENH